MSTHDMNSYDPGRPEKPPTETGNFLWYCLGGCLFMALLVVIGLGVLAYVVYTQGKAIAVEAARMGAIATVNESDLSANDKQEVIEQIDRIADDYKAGKLSNAQVSKLFDEFANSPLLQVGLVYMAEQQYLNPSGLSKEEKEAGSLTLNRVARGVHEGLIPPEAVEAALDPWMTTDAQGNEVAKEKVTDAEVREVLVTLKQLADDKQIPEEMFEIDVGGEFRKVVDRIYQQGP